MSLLFVWGGGGGGGGGEGGEQEEEVARVGRKNALDRNKENQIAHLSPSSSAVALATRNTIAGLSLLPPAPKICSAAACSIGCRSPTMPRRLAFICSMSAETGRRIAAEEAVLIVERVSGGESEGGGEGGEDEGGEDEGEGEAATVLEEEEDDEEELDTGAEAAAAAAATPLLL